MPPGPKRDQLVGSVFQECCRHGLVDIKVILNMRRSASSRALNELLKGTKLSSGMIEFGDIPQGWQNNLKNRQDSNMMRPRGI